MIKLVVSDLDGTLVCNHEVSKKNRDAIKNLKNKGVLFTVATGRHIDSARRVTDTLHLDLPIITSNGAQIINPNTYEILDEILMLEKDVYDIADFCDELDIMYMISTSKDIICTKELKVVINEHAGDVPVKVVSRDGLRATLSEPIIKVLAVEFDTEKMSKIKSFLSKKTNLVSVISQEGFINISSKESTKGNALKLLTSRLNISMEDVMTLGDEQNDLTMIKFAGIGVAMGNAVNELKKNANYVTSTNCEDGVAKAIEKFIK